MEQEKQLRLQQAQLNNQTLTIDTHQTNIEQVVIADNEEEEEIVNVRDSFALDYNPDYGKDMDQS